MKLASPYRCDYCPALKGEANHWFIRQLCTLEFILIEWNETLADKGPKEVEHICSDTCAAKALNKWLVAVAAVAAARRTKEIEHAEPIEYVPVEEPA